ncbi:hypothetical protein HG531_013134 [Fusarium graminearum]|nr:hypothetical protein HG531_013134 [Fusarium graminearum]
MPVCRFSRRIIRLLEDHRILYGSFNVLSDEDLWVNGELVGGLDIVREEFNTKPGYLTEYTVEDNVASKHGKKI